MSINGSGLVFEFRLRLNIGFFGSFSVINGCEPAGRGGGWDGGWSDGRGDGRGDVGCGFEEFGGFVDGKLLLVDGTVLLVEVLPSL